VVGVGLDATTGSELPHSLIDPPQTHAGEVEREERYVLEGKVQVEGAYRVGERIYGKVGRGSENKVPFVAAASLSATAARCESS
jgi:hypothetical protein